MDEIITTDSAMHSTSDISGVKDASTVNPENGTGCGFRVADGTANTDFGVAGELQSENAEGGDTLEAYSRTLQ